MKSAALLGGGVAAGMLSGCTEPGGAFSDSGTAAAPQLVNDVHSQFNPTLVSAIVRPTSEAEVARIVRRAASRGQRLSLSGARHAGGGQQFLNGQPLLDLRSLDSIFAFDPVRGRITIGAGAAWPTVLSAIAVANDIHGTDWAINQKQGGADSLTLGGAVSANAHGRCLDSPPMVADVESLQAVLPDGQIRTLSRIENAELFSLTIGGYGLFCIVTTVTLRLVKRRKLRLGVHRVKAESAIHSLEKCRVEEGAVHGDWQFQIDRDSSDFLLEGILTTYTPVDDAEPMTRRPDVDSESLIRLAALAHTGPSQAFELFAKNWAGKSGQVDWSDSWQRSDYTPDYHLAVDNLVGPQSAGTEALSEFYVPRPVLTEFLTRCAAWFRTSNAVLIYGVLRLIRQDPESFLSWARQDQACIIFNLHAGRGPQGRRIVESQLHGVARIAVELGGRFYLTYGCFADREQLLRGYPQLPDFLAAKQKFDPGGLLQSDWYLWLTNALQSR